MKKSLKTSAIILLAVLMASMGLIGSSSPASAYIYDGKCWNTDTVDFYHSSLPYDWRNEVLYAAYTWNWAGSNFTFNYDASSDNQVLTYYYGVPWPIAETYVYDNPITWVIEYFNTSCTFSIDGSSGYDVNTVALHEFGHWLQLLDIPEYQFWHIGKVMYGTYTGIKQSLTQDEIDGIIYIYGS
jgi:hypothetical protein